MSEVKINLNKDHFEANPRSSLQGASRDMNTPIATIQKTLDLEVQARHGENFVGEISKETQWNAADNFVERAKMCHQHDGGHFEHLK